ncbi:DUF4190 domain-containing protein [Cellulomonas sp. PhB143]|uniref:DUF4190 domain-containing protein n=1 Tax=Cellulomonas sp. PhB143 TaxID=2485186 RepID=UPI000F460301|nr:DUF4190 domain-containing protein [Cellulomonas sp. PhB143]ROS73305.1 hypothetical protein EDF32_2572 [Cellulomonas sp. PhB143]
MSGQHPGPEGQGTPEEQPPAQEHGSSGPSGQPPAYGQGQPPAYGQQPPAYGQQQPPAYGQPGGYGQPYPGAPAPYAPIGPVPGKTMGIVGFVLAFVLPLVGLIVSIVAFVQSRKAGAKNGLALAGIIIGAVLCVLFVVAAIVVFGLFGDVIQACVDNPNGTYTLNGSEYSCQG